MCQNRIKEKGGERETEKRREGGMKEGWERGKGRVRMGGSRHFSESTLEILTQLN